MKWMLLGLLNLLMIGEVFSAAVTFKLDSVCACKDGLSVSYGSCAQFCAYEVTNGSELFFAEFKMNPGNRFKTVNEWCNKARPYTRKNPKCALDVKDIHGNQTYLNLDHRGNNKIKANLEMLSHDQTYIVQLIELSTGQKSEAIQFIKFQNQ